MNSETAEEKCFSGRSEKLNMVNVICPCCFTEPKENVWSCTVYIAFVYGFFSVFLFFSRGFPYFRTTTICRLQIPANNCHIFSEQKHTSKELCFLFLTYFFYAHREKRLNNLNILLTYQLFFCIFFNIMIKPYVIMYIFEKAIFDFIFLSR